MNEDDTVKYLIMQSIEEDCTVNPKESIEYPPVAISFGEKLIKTSKGDLLLPIPIGTFGNFSVISGPPKTKKTFLVSLLASVFLGGKNVFGGKLKGHREDKDVIHIDTEQGLYHCSKTFKNVLDMNLKDYSEFYYTFGLRTIGYKQRLEFIEYCLEHKTQNPGLLILDGVADLVADVNDLASANFCTQKLMELSSKFNCHIICVIHNNFGTSKLTGHLGSALAKKSECVIELEQNIEKKDWVSAICKQSRGYSFETFSFKVNEIGLPEIIGSLFDPIKN